MFLFGGVNVYRNFFRDYKEIEKYEQEEIESELGLSRDDLIGIAKLFT